ncbi:MAG: guanylate kinase [Alphaproteobacteria bacterium]|nr:guanylate kinase [Alphaproteobacteria bacterium]
MADSEIRRRGLMLVLSSPSGAGKTTISRRLLEHDANLTLSISATTRPPRPGEEPGRDYIFVDEAHFAAMVERADLLEHAHVFGHDYGTPREPVETAIESGRDVLFDIDWQGTQQLKERVREDLVSVFILPPSTGALEQRLTERAQDSREVVAARMAKAADEMSHYPEYDYIVVNRDITDSVARVRAILMAERHRRARLVGLGDFVNNLRRGQ